MSLTYTNYLKINELLELQQLKSDPKEHDETLFIIIHQTYELWFKQIIHEFGKLNNQLSAGNTRFSGGYSGNHDSTGIQQLQKVFRGIEWISVAAIS